MTGERVAIITGAASGMGRVLALRLAAAGWRVAGLDLNKAALAELAAASNGISTYPCDVANSEEVTEIVARLTAECGPPERLLHAAALMPAGAVIHTTAAAINRLMAINYGGTVNLVTAVLPGMLARNRGEIVAFSSIAGIVPAPHMAPYCATKAAVSMFMEILMHEHEDSGLSFLVVCPPVVDTPLLKQMQGAGPSTLMRQIEKGNVLKPEQVADAIEAALKSGKRFIYPADANAAQWMRRLAPGMLWKTMREPRRA